jgi:hypothetical protein
MIRSIAFGAAISVLVSAAACGARTSLEGGQINESAAGSTAIGDNSGAAGAPGVLGTLCGTFLDAVCTYYTQCQGEHFANSAHCHSELDCYGVPALLEALAEHHVTINEDALAKCFQNFNASPCDPPRENVTLQNAQLDIYRFLDPAFSRRSSAQATRAGPMRSAKCG